MPMFLHAPKLLPFMNLRSHQETRFGWLPVVLLLPLLAAVGLHASSCVRCCVLQWPLAPAVGRDAEPSWMTVTSGGKHPTCFKLQGLRDAKICYDLLSGSWLCHPVARRGSSLLLKLPISCLEHLEMTPKTTHPVGCSWPQLIIQFIDLATKSRKTRNVTAIMWQTLNWTKQCLF